MINTSYRAERRPFRHPFTWIQILIVVLSAVAITGLQYMGRNGSESIGALVDESRVRRITHRMHVVQTNEDFCAIQFCGRDRKGPFSTLRIYRGKEPPIPEADDSPTTPVRLFLSEGTESRAMRAHLDRAEKWGKGLNELTVAENAEVFGLGIYLNKLPTQYTPTPAFFLHQSSMWNSRMDPIPPGSYLLYYNTAAKQWHLGPAGRFKSIVLVLRYRVAVQIGIAAASLLICFLFQYLHCRKTSGIRSTRHP